MEEASGSLLSFSAPMGPHPNGDVRGGLPSSGVFCVRYSMGTDCCIVIFYCASLNWEVFGSKDSISELCSAAPLSLLVLPMLAGITQTRIHPVVCLLPVASTKASNKVL